VIFPIRHAELQPSSSITSATGSVVTSHTAAFTASLINQATGSNASTGPVTWSVVSGGVTIDTNGVYTAPALMGTGRTIAKAGRHPAEVVEREPFHISMVFSVQKARPRWGRCFGAGSVSLMMIAVWLGVIF
jgi:hypothetical protein